MLKFWVTRNCSAPQIYMPTLLLPVLCRLKNVEDDQTCPFLSLFSFRSLFSRKSKEPKALSHNATGWRLFSKTAPREGDPTKEPASKLSEQQVSSLNTRWDHQHRHHQLQPQHNVSWRCYSSSDWLLLFSRVQRQYFWATVRHLTLSVGKLASRRGAPSGGFAGTGQGRPPHSLCESTSSLWCKNRHCPRVMSPCPCGAPGVINSWVRGSGRLHSRRCCDLCPQSQWWLTETPQKLLTSDFLYNPSKSRAECASMAPPLLSLVFEHLSGETVKPFLAPASP